MSKEASEINGEEQITQHNDTKILWVTWTLLKWVMILCVIQLGKW